MGPDEGEDRRPRRAGRSPPSATSARAPVKSRSQRDLTVLGQVELLVQVLPAVAPARGVLRDPVAHLPERDPVRPEQAGRRSRAPSTSYFSRPSVGGRSSPVACGSRGRAPRRRRRGPRSSRGRRGRAGSPGRDGRRSAPSSASAYASAGGMSSGGSGRYSGVSVRRSRAVRARSSVAIRPPAPITGSEEHDVVGDEVRPASSNAEYSSSSLGLVLLDRVGSPSPLDDRGAAGRGDRVAREDGPHAAIGRSPAGSLGQPVDRDRRRLPDLRLDAERARPQPCLGRRHAAVARRSCASRWSSQNSHWSPQTVQVHVDDVVVDRRRVHHAVAELEGPLLVGRAVVPDDPQAAPGVVRIDAEPAGPVERAEPGVAAGRRTPRRPRRRRRR